MFSCVSAIDYENYINDEPYCAFINHKEREYFFVNKFYQSIKTHKYVIVSSTNFETYYFYGNIQGRIIFPWNALYEELEYRKRIYEFKIKYADYRAVYKSI